MQIRINKGTIEVIKGDITEQTTDAIVNASNNHLWMGAGVAGAIKRKGGIEIEQQAIAQGPVEIGNAVITTAGKLQSKFVIHAAVMGQDLHTNPENIKNATKSSLKFAEQKKITSICFPALGTGVGGFSIFHCAKIMITEAIDFLSSSQHLKLVKIVLFDEQTFNAFTEELKLQFSVKRH